MNSMRPAFPVIFEHAVATSEQYGLSKREYFAAKAMQGWMASYPDNMEARHAENGAHVIARMAYAVADEMLAASDEPQPVQPRELYADEKQRLDAADRLAAAVSDIQKVSAYLAIPAALREPLERAMEDVQEPAIPF